MSPNVYMTSNILPGTLLQFESLQSCIVPHYSPDPAFYYGSMLTAAHQKKLMAVPLASY